LPPADPTPINPYALKLAIADTSLNVAYLGRPCQYLSDDQLAKCPLAQWTDARFGDDAITLTSRSIDEIKAKSKATALRLVGYSGGGALATLVAAQRHDVNCLVTVAAPLDIGAWVEVLKVSPLKSSHNPATDTDSTTAIRQTHFQGGGDTVVPPSTTLAYRFRHPTAKFDRVENYDHDCCWDNDWATRIATACR
jgi:pimeloyl-ACP methyl ester carboxylesterase